MDEDELKAQQEAEAQAKADADAADKAKKAKEQSGGGNAPSDDKSAAEIERLTNELNAAKAAAAKFDGIDPEVARENAKKVAEAETARRTAEAEKAKAEGNFERLRELQNEEHEAKLVAARTERDTAQAERAQAIADAALARREAAFARSEFFAKETILSPTKAERLYGDYVEIENGRPVVYDAPKDAAKRTKFMDSKGNPLAFDVAMKKVVDAEPDKDTFIKSKMQPGGGSRTEQHKNNTPPPTDRLAKMAEGLRKLRGE